MALGGDGQVTLGNVVAKADAVKIRRLGPGGGKVLTGFAGSAADAFALIERFEKKLGEHPDNTRRAVIELAKEWRTDRALRQLQAQMVVCDRGKSFLLSGSGDLLQPDDGVLSIGSGANFALAAARALLAHTELAAREVEHRFLLFEGEGHELLATPNRVAFVQAAAGSPPCWKR